MVAASDACYCAACGAKCVGKFAACKEVWAGQPPIPASFVEVSAKTHATRNGNGSSPGSASTNGTGMTDRSMSLKVSAERSPDDSHDVQSSLTELSNVVSQLVTTVKQLVEAEREVSGRQAALDASVTHIEHDMGTLANRVEQLSTKTSETLQTHNQALQAIAKRLRGTNTRPSAPQPTAPQQPAAQAPPTPRYPQISDAKPEPVNLSPAMPEAVPPPPAPPQQ